MLFATANFIPKPFEIGSVSKEPALMQKSSHWFNSWAHLEPYLQKRPRGFEAVPVLCHSRTRCGVKHNLGYCVVTSCFQSFQKEVLSFTDFFKILGLLLGRKNS